MRLELTYTLITFPDPKSGRKPITGYSPKIYHLQTPVLDSNQREDFSQRICSPPPSSTRPTGDKINNSFHRVQLSYTLLLPTITRLSAIEASFYETYEKLLSAVFSLLTRIIYFYIFNIIFFHKTYNLVLTAGLEPTYTNYAVKACV